MDTLTLLTSSSFGSLPVDFVRGQKAIRFLSEGWRAAVVAQLSAGWRALEAKLPNQAKAIKLLSDTAAEQASASSLTVYNAVITYIADNIETPFLAPVSEEAKSVLAEMKSALSDRQGSIDPSSSKAFALLDQILGAAPVSGTISAGRKMFLSKIQQDMRTSPEFRKLTDLYYRLDGTARAVALILLAGAGGTAWVASSVKTNNDGVTTISAPPSLKLEKTGTTLDLGSITIKKDKESEKSSLKAISASVAQQIGKSGLSATAAAEYKKGNPLYASGGVRYTTYLPQNARLMASADVTTQFAPYTTSVQAKIEAGKTLGRKQGLDLSAYAQTAIPERGPAAYQAGAKFTQAFGANAPRKRRANPAVVRRLSGPLPWLSRLFRPKRGQLAVPQPYLEPTPASPPLPTPTPLPWTQIVMGTAVLGGLGWLGWRSRTSA